MGRVQIIPREAWKFAIDYRKLNANTQYPQFSISVIDAILANIMSTNFISTIGFSLRVF